MLAIEAIAAGLPGPPPSPDGERVCCVTGRRTASPVARRDVFSAVFGSQAILAAPHSDYVDSRLAEVLGNGQLRWSTWVLVDGGLEICKRRMVRDLLRNPPPGLWAAYAAEDMRRHGGLLTVCNHGDDPAAVIQIGQSRASVVRALRLYPTATALADAGARRSEIASLEFGRTSLRKIGISAAMRAKRTVGGMAKSPEWRLACWLLPTEEEKTDGP